MQEPLGMGLRFLGLDGKSARYLDDYVHERASLPATSAAGRFDVIRRAASR